MRALCKKRHAQGVIKLASLTAEKIMELMQSPKKESKLGFYRTTSGERIEGIVPADLVGKMDGKTGSMRRSRKGRTYRAPNGSRRYIASDAIREDVAYYRIRQI